MRCDEMRCDAMRCAARLRCSVCLRTFWWARLGSARLGSARLGSARLGSAQLGLAQLGLAQLQVWLAWLGQWLWESAPIRASAPASRHNRGDIYWRLQIGDVP